MTEDTTSAGAESSNGIRHLAHVTSEREGWRQAREIYAPILRSFELTALWGIDVRPENGSGGYAVVAVRHELPATARGGDGSDAQKRRAANGNRKGTTE